MLDRLDPAVFTFTCILVEACCIALGFVAESLLKDGGFSRLVNIAVLNAGAFGALFGFDLLYRWSMLPLWLQNVEAWIIAPPVGACVLLILVFLGKLAVGQIIAWRHARMPQRGL